MKHRPIRSIRANKRVLIATIAVLLVATLVAIVAGITGHKVRSASAAVGGLGQLSGLLPRDHLTEESAIQVDLDKETVRMPLYPGEAHGQKVWFILLDASDVGLAHDLGVNYAPKLANMAISCPACVQTVTIDSPTPAQNPFGPALVHFQGAPDFSPTRIAVPGPQRLPARQVPAWCRGRPRIQPLHSHRGFAGRLQRSHRGHRQRSVRRCPPYQHGGSGPRYPHRTRDVAFRTVPGVMGRPVVCQGL